MYAAILLFGVTLTLPGFAGLILTIGVAADANVVVFERIKEEVRAGKSMRAAIAAGYAKGFHTIIDANVVTAITALILFAVATAGVKGFALMLLIGTVVSLITAVAATRAMLGLLAGFSWFQNPSFMGAHHSQRGHVPADRLHGAPQALVRDLGRRHRRQRRLARRRAGSTSASTSGAACRSRSRRRSRPRSRRCATQTAAIGQRRTRSSRAAGTSYGGEELQELPDPPEEAEARAEQNKLQADARQTRARTLQGSARRTSRRASAARSRKSAVLAIIFSLLVITLYITIRFRGLAFAVPVIIAMLHDVLITVGVYSLTGREVTEATVAAVLTVLGYSIYDTIIIFDRIRENMPIMRRASFATIANVSLWETIRRSLATTFITLLPVGALFFFGGATLKDFAFALLVGVTSGAYSSIFIAAPLLDVLEGARARSTHRRKGRRLDRRLARQPRARGGREGCGGRADARDAARRRRGRASPTATRGEEASGAASGARRVLMAEPGSALAERDALDRLIAVLGPRLDEAALARSTTSRRAGAATRCAWGRDSRSRIQELARELGLVTREEWDELELRVAQLEHRLRLLEEGDLAAYPCYPELCYFGVRSRMAAFP